MRTMSSADDEVIANGMSKNAITNNDLNACDSSPPCDTTDSCVPEQKTSPSKEDITTTANSNGNARTKHATLGIYVPPSLRSGDGIRTQLNVFAKEFVMGSKGTKSKRSDDNQSTSSKLNALSTSKSSITVFDLTKTNSSQYKANDNQKIMNDLQRVKSSGDVLLENNINPKVQFNVPYSEKGDRKFSRKTSPTKKSPSISNTQSLLNNLKRSKSLNAADALKLLTLETSLPNYSKTFTEYALFPEKLHGLIRQAVTHTDQIQDKNKIILGRTVVEQAVEEKKLALPAAKLSVIVMDKDNTGAYLDSLLNTCQMLHQTKNENALANPTKLAAFLAFLQELYTELKRSKLQLKLSTESVTPPKLTVLLLIVRCCEDILMRSGTYSITEIECVFHVLTTVGRDIEGEMPNKFVKLFDTIKEVLLAGRNKPEVQKLLLQLIELRAAKMQLPISALNYYYPKITA